MADWERNFSDKPVKTTVKAIFIGSGVVFLFMTALWALGLITLPGRTVANVAERTLSADNVLYNYEWFKRQYQDIQAMDTKLAAAEQAMVDFETAAGPRDGWKFEDRQEWNRLNSITLGLRSQRADMVALYNARAQMANRSIFKTDDLPVTLN